MAREPHRSSEILDAVALLVVDMQDAFLNVMPDRDAVLRRTALAIESARAFGIKVIFTEQVPAKLGPTNADLLALAPEARVFAKNEFSALLAEGLHDYLRRINVYHLLLAGIETPICIYQTALHAQDNDLDVTLLSDCTTGRRPEDCVIVLEALSRAECHVLPAETVFYSMLGSSLNPRFPHFTRIVKRYASEEPIGGGPTPPPEIEPRADGEARRDQGHHGGGRHDDRRRSGRHEGGRGRGERPPGRPDAGQSMEQAAAERDEPADDLAAEDGISEDEANQPSYEEATAEHSDVDADTESDETRGSARREPAQTTEGSGADTPNPAGETDSPESDEDAETEGDSSAEDAPSEDGQPKKRRGRRRRGGARRRRARERAAAAAQGQPESGSAEGNDAGAPDAPSSDEPAASQKQDGGGDSGAPDGPPAP